MSEGLILITNAEMDALPDIAGIPTRISDDGRVWPRRVYTLSEKVQLISGKVMFDLLTKKD